MILHLVNYTDPVVGHTVDLWKPTKAEAEQEARAINKQPGSKGDARTSEVDVPTTEGREALAAWLNARYSWPDGDPIN